MIYVWKLSILTWAGCYFISDDQLAYRKGLSTESCTTTYFPDEDGDGYGAGEGVEGCEAPVGYTDNDDDCDDNNPLISPVQTEDCNTAIDDNCNGQSNELNALNCITWYADNDADGYGAESDSACYCEMTVEYPIESGTDCDDNEQLVHPDMEEICDDGLDNNCDNSANDCGLDSPLSAENADFLFYGQNASAAAGSSVSAAGNLLPSGKALLISAPFNSGTGENQGTVYVVSQNDDSNLDQAPAQITGSIDNGYLGLFTTPTADLNGDGNDDLILAAPLAANATANNAGQAYVFYGPLNGSYNSSDADVILLGQNQNDRFGWAITTGDFMNSGEPMLAVGAHNVDNNALNNNGAIYLYQQPLSSVIVADQADIAIFGANNSDFAGYTLTAGTDFNGDGIHDLATGGIKTNNDTGAVHLIAGPVLQDTTLDAAAVIWNGENAGDQAGGTISSAGDISGDGVEDLAIASTGKNIVYIVDGQLTGQRSLAEASVRIENITGNGSVLSLSSMGDVNGDTFDDFALGAPNGNQAYLFYGPISGVLDATTADVVFNGQTGEQLGYSVTSPGDLNADGLDDIAIGARYNSSIVNKAGATYLFMGLGL